MDKRGKITMVSTPSVPNESVKNWMEEVKKQWGEDNARELMKRVGWYGGFDFGKPAEPVFSFFDEYDHVIQKYDLDLDQDALIDEYETQKK